MDAFATIPRAGRGARRPDVYAGDAAAVALADQLGERCRDAGGFEDALVALGDRPECMTDATPAAGLYAAVVHAKATELMSGGADPLTWSLLSWLGTVELDESSGQVRFVKSCPEELYDLVARTLHKQLWVRVRKRELPAGFAAFAVDVLRDTVAVHLARACATDGADSVLDDGIVEALCDERRQDERALGRDCHAGVWSRLLAQWHDHLVDDSGQDGGYRSTVTAALTELLAEPDGDG